MELGPYLKKLREEKGLSLREAAKRSGVSHPYISQLETGKNENPSLEKLMKLATTYDCPKQELLAKSGLTKHVKYEDLVKTGYYEDLENYIKEERKKSEEWEEKFKKKNDILLQLKNRDNTFYLNGYELTDDDRKRLIDGLKLIFPNYTRGD